MHIAIQSYWMIDLMPLSMYLSVHLSFSPSTPALHLCFLLPLCLSIYYTWTILHYLNSFNCVFSNAVIPYKFQFQYNEGYANVVMSTSDFRIFCEVSKIMDRRAHVTCYISKSWGRQEDIFLSTLYLWSNTESCETNQCTKKISYEWGKVVENVWMGQDN